jgi:surface antigen
MPLASVRGRNRNLSYHGSGARRAWQNLAATVVLALGASGCAASFPLSSLLPSNGEEKAAAKGDRADITGSLPLQPASLAIAEPAMSQTDWTLARTALREALKRPEDGASIPWENPMNGARGTVTPIAAAYARDGFACRNFLASHVRQGRESWFEGTACRMHRGEWDIQSSRPLQKS